MRIFFSVGEPSGDLHGANLIRSLSAIDPKIECLGFGGEHMAAAGCRLNYPLAQHAVMGFVRIFGSMHKFLSLVSQADRWFAQHRPDAVVLIDFPGFNWWIARRAHFHGIPVFYFVPPQLWGWAGWRVEKMRKWVDHVLCTLPFEVPWYEARGVKAHYVGHPYFDELAEQSFDEQMLADQRARPGRIVALLPGSRTQEVEHNISTMLRAADRVHGALPDTRFLVASFKPAHAEFIREKIRKRGDNIPIEVVCRKTPEVIRLAEACVAVSGSVGLELLYQEKPTTVIYRVSKWEQFLVRKLRTCSYISIVNLLAGKELFPEYLSTRCEAAAVANHLLDWLTNRPASEAMRQELAALSGRVSERGACERAARFIYETLQPAGGIGQVA